MKNANLLKRVLILLLLLPFSSLIGQTFTISGELKEWHKVTIAFDGPSTSELASPNPFADYKFDITFIHGLDTFVVPGYFGADGDAAETSADNGDQWIAHFAPNDTGTWTFQTSFVEGTDIAINGQSGVPGVLDGLSGSFYIQDTDKTGRDHRGRGRLSYVGEHYLQFEGDSSWFYKAGADAPENTLAYEDFDDVPDRGGRRKSWIKHQVDFDFTDSIAYTWQNGKGSELMGVVNYLANTGANAFSFLTFSLAGDDENVFPHLLKVDIPTYNTYGDAQQWDDGVYHDRFDISKMAQWEKIFEYADKRGMYLHFKTQETENDQKMDGGDVGRERKLYYRELIARFGHHLALNWNTGEENTQTTQQEIDMAAYLMDTDPYRHNTVMHTYPGQYYRYANLIGSQSEYSGASIQTSNRTYNELFSVVKTWVDSSRNVGKKWIIAVDEPGNASIGVHSDPNDIKLVREKVLWGTMLAGGAGVEYYYGYQSGCGDLNCDDHRSREDKYYDAGRAVDFFNNYMQEYLPLVFNDNAITSNSDDYAMTNGTNMVLVYLPNGGSTGITLNSNQSWSLDWYNPRTGAYDDANIAVTNQITAVDTEDWVALITANCLPEGTMCDDGNSNTTMDTIDANCNCIGVDCPPQGTSCDDGNPNTVNDIENGSCICMGTAPIQVPNRVEAEDFFDQMGVQTETCSDTGGGLNVGYIENGDYTKYKIEVVTPGTYGITFRVASNNAAGGTINYTLGDSTGSVVVPYTTGWQTWVDVIVQDSFLTGIYDLNLDFTGGASYLFNLNYIDFTLINCTAGTPCDDGNPNTENDVLDAGCSCAGTPILYTSPLIEAEDVLYGSKWTLTSDSTACQFKFLLPPNQTEYNNPPSTIDDLVEFVFNIDNAGMYKVFARVLTTSGDDDSFWVKANSGAWQKWNKINFPYSNIGYQWSQVGNWTSGDYATPVEFDLPVGENKIYFSWREPGAKLDKIYVTQENLNKLNQVRTLDSLEEFSFSYTVLESCPNDTITFDPILNLDTIKSDHAIIDIDHPLVVLGNGVNNTIISGEGANPIFNNTSSNLIVKRVRLIEGSSVSDGGAFINNGTMYMGDMIIEKNLEGINPKAFTNFGTMYILANEVVLIKE